MPDAAPPFEPTDDQLAHARDVVRVVLEHIAESRTIALPPFDPSRDGAPSDVALLSVAREPNRFGGALGIYCYQFEGEEDLLHVFFCRLDSEPLSVAEGQRVFSTLMPGVPPALVWLKPGRVSQHFYFGHDVLLESSPNPN